MNNELLLNVVTSILGPGDKTSKGNFAFSCPKCKHHKKKLEINFTINPKGEYRYNCWTCGGSLKGKKLHNLFRVLGTSKEKLEEIKKYTGLSFNIDKEIIIKNKKIELPEEYISLHNEKLSLDGRQALSYLKKRGISKYDIIQYNIGYCEKGKYEGRIIIPSYGYDNNVDFFVARAYRDNIYPKYLNSEHNKEIIPFERNINWNLPLVLCEGVFDMFSLKRNTIPLLGKQIQNALYNKIINSDNKKIYICLDKDAYKESLKICEMLFNEGKEVYLVSLNEGDPGSAGFKKMVELLHNTKKMKFSDLIEYKMK